MHQRTEVWVDDEGFFRAFTAYWFEKNRPLDIRTCRGELIPSMPKNMLAEHVRAAGKYEQWTRDIPANKIQDKLQAWRKKNQKDGYTYRGQYEGT